MLAISYDGDRYDADRLVSICFVLYLAIGNCVNSILFWFYKIRCRGTEHCYLYYCYRNTLCDQQLIAKYVFGSCRLLLKQYQQGRNKQRCSRIGSTFAVTLLFFGLVLAPLPVVSSCVLQRDSIARSLVVYIYICIYVYVRSLLNRYQRPG